MSTPSSLWSSTGTEHSGNLPELLDAYFLHVSEEDQESLGPDGRKVLVQDHLQLARQKSFSAPAVEVHSAHTYAELRVVQTDMPFLVDSVAAEISGQGHSIQMVAHPTFITHRDTESGDLKELHAIPAQQQLASGDTSTLTGMSALKSAEGMKVGIESWISIRTVGPLTTVQIANLEQGIQAVLKDVELSVTDWDTMRAAAHDAAQTLREVAPSRILQIEESAQLLEWMADGNFTFIGYREYVLQHGDNNQVLAAVEGTGLGVLASRDKTPPVALTVAGSNQIEQPNALIITKTNARSRVHRHSYMDYVAVKTFNKNGKVVGERRFIGLWSSATYAASVNQIPLIRIKVAEVLRLAGFAHDSHSGSELTHLLETYPRDEIFQMDSAGLWAVCREILQMEERRRTRLFLRADIYGRFMSAIVYLPRDRYNTAVRERIEALLLRTFDGESIEYQVLLTESTLARLFFRVKLPRHWERVGQVDVNQLEHELVATVRSWKEGINEQSTIAFGEDDGILVAQLWDEAFPPEYRVRYEVEDALEDISRFTALSDEGKPSVYLVQQEDEDEQEKPHVRMKLYADTPRRLTDILPVLQNVGLEVTDERPYEISPTDGRIYYLYDLGLEFPDEIELGAVSTLVAETVAQAMVGQISSDVFNRLVLHQGLDSRIVAVLRAYGQYLRQLTVPNSLDFMAETLLGHPTVTSRLVEFFRVRFDPDAEEAGTDHTEKYDGAASAARIAALEPIREEILNALDAVPTLDADRVLRGFLTIMEATERTNAYQGHDYLTFKISPARIPFAPQPRPTHEIWVNSPQVSGTHLRFGAVARGGLRWSDRREDFRTEVLGLVQTQQVKNSVIVPTGAKGGFFAHQLPDPGVDRGAWVEAGRSAYQTFIRGMLDITDNQHEEDGQTVVTTRPNIVRHDGTDPYLVVAADKGTASFSDTANEISIEYGHWLGDAFASGGSEGYDHKGMGITARGAWESVKSHFASIGHDVQTQDFTVVGIGDMSGDVFGNGMLRSPHIKLVAAFNHLHIFVDPDPDPASSFEERQRLFDLPRSSWNDYRSDLISAGGGVFDRKAKAVPISEQMRRLLGLPSDTQEMSPQSLLKAILQADVDLLYNGGIGTYIKASHEGHDSVGDRANDAIRVDGSAIRATVVGEGGNLGATQAGRVEAALHGVLLNTDAIDNSGGVDTSDHEVNIKILLDQMIREKTLDKADRVELLESMTEEVAGLVLATNRAQNILLRNDGYPELGWMPSYIRHTNWLVENAGLDRELEHIPSTVELNERVQEGHGYTTPELAVLAAYTKINLTDQLLATELPDDPWLEQVLVDYFPPLLQKRAPEAIKRHPLRRQIIAMSVANKIINIAGTTFVFRTQEETGADTATVVKAMLTIIEAFQFTEYSAALEELPPTFDTKARALAWQELRRLLDRGVRWMINQHNLAASLHEHISTFEPLLRELMVDLPQFFTGEVKERFERWRDTNLRIGFPDQLAARRAMGFESYALLDIVALSEEMKTPSQRIAEVYFRLYDDFDMDHMLDIITALPRQTRWQSLARGAIREDFYLWLTKMSESILEEASSIQQPVDKVMQAWYEKRRLRIDRVRQFMDDIADHLEPDPKTGRTDLATLTVLLRRLKTLTT